MADFSRPAGGWRYELGGLNVKDVADAIPYHKMPIAVNVRSTANKATKTRPGYVKNFDTFSIPVTDVRAYSDFYNNNNPRYLARNASNQIYLDNGTQVGSLSGGGNGAFLIPFRPGAAVAPWMYVAGPKDYQKFSSPGAQPSAVGGVTQYKVGIRENQSAPTTSPRAFSHYDFNGIAVNWANTGTAGATADSNRPADTIVYVIADPASNSERWTAQVSDVVDGYQIQQQIVIDSGGLNYATIIEDVLPALKGTYSVQSIYYYTGSIGRCLVVPNQLPADPTVPNFSSSIPTALPLSSQEEIATLRRGSLITINGDKCLILSVITGPTGTISLEVLDNTGGHSAGQAILGLPAIVVGNIAAGAAGKGITASYITTTVTTGIGYIARALATNPFTQQLSPIAVSVQPNDYVALQFNISDITKLTSITVTFDVNNGATDYVTNAFYRTFQPSDLLGFTPSSVTSLATSPWYTLLFPISTLARIGGDETRTLQNCQGMRIAFTVTASTQFELASLHIGGGGSPDVGNNAPYFYTAIPRDSHTGAIGNPAPITRYGVNPRRQSVYVNITDDTGDVQVDFWDVYRFGGSVNSWRYIGSIANPLAGGTVTFTDNYFDTSALAGSRLEFNNFEPWPSIDVPFAVTASTVGNITSQILLYGGAMIMVWSSPAPFVNPAPTTITRWLPGSLIQLGGQSAYTLYSRPKAVVLTAPPAVNYFAYLIETVENMGSGSASSILVQEPNIANQPLYGVWGPDESGTVFGVGDSLRPGVFYYAKPYNPDSVSDANSIELAPPSEPLLGGEIINGTCYVASTKRWWRLYPQISTNTFQQVEAPIGHPLAAIYGHCSDGDNLYFWGKDGIYKSGGNRAASLTDDDLYPLFPHEGVLGTDYTYNGVIVKAPDYTKSDTFRLSWYNGFIYADYQDSAGVYHSLVLDTHQVSDAPQTRWVVDQYADSVTCHYGLERAANTLLLGTTAGSVMQERDLHNDVDTPITCDVATFEYNGGDERADMFWGDLFIDALPASIITCTPLSSGVAISSDTTIAKNSIRQRAQVSIGGGQFAKFLGLRAHWVDDFTTQALPTTLYTWQPSFIPKQEVTTNRYTDWDDGGLVGAKYMQGLILEADTNGVNKLIQVRDAETNSLHTLQPAPINHNGQTEIAYSFGTPFIAHLIRIEPGDLVPWRFYKARWVYEPTPESAYTWKTQGTAFGMPGYKFIQRVVAAYSSMQPVTLTITTYDGVSPAVITLPSTCGAYKKILFTLTYNKGQLYFFTGVSTAPWQPYLNDWEIHVGNWGRQSPMMIYRNLGSEHGAMAKV